MRIERRASARRKPAARSPDEPQTSTRAFSSRRSANDDDVAERPVTRAGARWRAPVRRRRPRCRMQPGAERRAADQLDRPRRPCSSRHVASERRARRHRGRQPARAHDRARRRRSTMPVGVLAPQRRFGVAVEHVSDAAQSFSARRRLRDLRVDDAGSDAKRSEHADTRSAGSCRRRRDADLEGDRLELARHHRPHDRRERRGVRASVQPQGRRRGGQRRQLEGRADDGGEAAERAGDAACRDRSRRRSSRPGRRLSRARRRWSRAGRRSADRAARRSDGAAGRCRWSRAMPPIVAAIGERRIERQPLAVRAPARALTSASVRAGFDRRGQIAVLVRQNAVQRARMSTDDVDAARRARPSRAWCRRRG